MAQKVLFPGTHMRITQDEYSTYSHAGSLARDDGGESTAFDSPVLAPFDGYFARVRTDSSHETYFVSEGPVECANGYVGVVTFLFMHDNVNRFSAGTHKKQGDTIGYEGGFGNGRKDAFSHHTHREWSKGRNTTQSQNSQGTYVIANQLHEYDVCYLRPDTQVYTGSGFRAAKDFGGTVKDNMGHTFKIAEEENEMVQPLSPDNITMQIGPASSGDRAALKKQAQSLGLGYSEGAVDGSGNALVYIGPASSGDQRMVLTKAAALGLGYCIYTPPAETPDEPDKPAEDDVEALRAELEAAQAEAQALRNSLVSVTAARDTAVQRAEQAEAQAQAAAERAERAEKDADTYLQKIEAARAALED